MNIPGRNILAGLVAVLMLIGPASAVPESIPPATVVQAPAWSVGSEWHYSDGYALKVSSVSSQGTVFERLDAPGQWFSRLGFIRKDAASATAARNSVYRTVPDSAGFSLSAAAPLTFQREYMSNGKLMVHASSWTLEGRETITVPAGTFDCWLIVWRTRSLRSDWTGFERWWYSPQAQSYVRMEYKYGAEPAGSRVLTRYQLGRSEPAPVPAAAPMPAAAAVPPLPAVPTRPFQVVPPAPLAQHDDVRRLLPVTPAAAEPAKTRAEAPPPIAPSVPAAKEADKTAAPQEPAKRLAGGAVRPPAVPALKDAGRVAWSEAAAKTMPRPDTTLTPVRLVKDDVRAVGTWHAQIGSSKDAAGIRKSLQAMLQDNPQLEALPNGVSAHNVGDRGLFYRAWLGAYDRAGQALALCQSLKTGKPGCAVFRSVTVEARADQ